MRMDTRIITALILMIVSHAAVAGSLKPKDLPAPTELTCINVQEPLSFTDHVGWFKEVAIMRFERGPYVSEKSDGKGTFYRAPPGGITIAPKPPRTGKPFDGGLYVPNDGSAPVRIYLYASNGPAPVEVPPREANCSTVGYVKDPATAKLSIVTIGPGGIDGDAAYRANRSVTAAGRLSPGQSIVAGAVGGVVAGIIVVALANMDVGKIYFPRTPVPDTEFLEKLRALAATKIALLEVRTETGSPGH